MLNEPYLTSHMGLQSGPQLGNKRKENPNTYIRGNLANYLSKNKTTSKNIYFYQTQANKSTFRNYRCVYLP